MLPVAVMCTLCANRDERSRLHQESTMKIYDDYVLPALLDCLCGVSDIAEQRQQAVPAASGTVLEIGMGTGLNLPYYDERRVDKVIGLDPSVASFRKALERSASRPFPVEYLGLSGEDIPLPEDSMDSIVLTYTLCSIAEPAKALSEMRRVLKPGGKLIFCEHGKSSGERVYRWQQRVTPVWKRLVGGCHLDRDIPGLIGNAGFRVLEMESGYINESVLQRLAAFQYRGVAVIA